MRHYAGVAFSFFSPILLYAGRSVGFVPSHWTIRNSYARGVARREFLSLLQAKSTVSEERKRLEQAQVDQPDKKAAVKYFDKKKGQVKVIDRPDPPKDDLEQQDLFLVMYIMLNLSSMMYIFSAIRKFAREATDGDGIDDFDIVNPELVLTQAYEGVRKFGESRYLKRVITLKDLATFLDENLSIFDKQDDFELNTEPGDMMNIMDIIDKAKNINADLREFDDGYAETQLVYGILVNQ